MRTQPVSVLWAAAASLVESCAKWTEVGPSRSSGRALTSSLEMRMVWSWASLSEPSAQNENMPKLYRLVFGGVFTASTLT